MSIILKKSSKHSKFITFFPFEKWLNHSFNIDSNFWFISLLLLITKGNGSIIFPVKIIFSNSNFFFIEFNVKLSNSESNIFITFEFSFCLQTIFILISDAKISYFSCINFLNSLKLVFP